ncbi:MAG: hypothetical protein WBC73_21165 [Phormidesmis sp.]
MFVFRLLGQSVAPPRDQSPPILGQAHRSDRCYGHSHRHSH